MRRYPQFRSTPAQVVALPSVGSVVETQTVSRRRFPQLNSTPSMAKMLPSLGVPAAVDNAKSPAALLHLLTGGYA